MNGNASLLALVRLVWVCCLWGACIGCQDKRAVAKRQVIEGLNAARILVENGQSAVLDVSTGYACIVLTTTLDNSQYWILWSSNGNFNGQETQSFGTITDRVLVPVGNRAVWVGGGSDRATLVELQRGDFTTRIAHAKQALPKTIENIHFSTNKPIDPKDVLRSIGMRDATK
jgi:hypothetical protein